MLVKYFIVGSGAAIGGISRFWMANFVHRFLPASFPFGTLAVNFTGSFLVGLIMFYFDEREIISPEIRLFLTIGFCGGFTTFSTFSLETINLFKNAEFLLASANIILSVFLCLAGTYLAYVISR